MLKISPAQARAARGLLGITQAELAGSAGLGLSTIVDFERERRQVSPAAVDAIAVAFENAGLEFISENGGGPGVRFRKRRGGSAGRPRS